MSKLNKYIELIFVGIVTALLYYFTYMFQIGYLSYYNIPSSFAEISLPIMIRIMIFLFFITTFFLLSIQGMFSFLIDRFPKRVSNDVRILSILLLCVLYLSSLSVKYHKISVLLVFLILLTILKRYQIYKKCKQKYVKEEKSDKDTPLFFENIMKNYPSVYNILLYMIIIMFIGNFVQIIGGLIAEFNPNEVEININNRKAVVVSEYKSKLIIKYKKANSSKLEDGFNIVDIKDNFKMILKEEKGVFNIAPF
ncbi:hypothetical protein [Clostridium botulinum]|uniref:hypothetical protein n=1 Tax=Clostridium botulinum TaxID=1491 RepID=UPI003DA5987F